jgi:hypothetical protein
MDNQIPMKDAKTFTEQINTKVKPSLKDKYVALKDRGVDVGELSRSALEPVIMKAYESLFGDASGF